jgi:hypothetical protein
MQEKAVPEKSLMGLMLQQQGLAQESVSRLTQKMRRTAWLHSQEMGMARVFAPTPAQPFMQIKECVCTNRPYAEPSGDAPPPAW